jgi:hypothetical protein
VLLSRGAVGVTAAHADGQEATVIAA